MSENSGEHETKRVTLRMSAEHVEFYLQLIDAVSRDENNRVEVIEVTTTEHKLGVDLEKLPAPRVEWLTDAFATPQIPVLTKAVLHDFEDAYIQETGYTRRNTNDLRRALASPPIADTNNSLSNYVVFPKTTRDLYSGSSAEVLIRADRIAELANELAAGTIKLKSISARNMEFINAVAGSLDPRDLLPPPAPFLEPTSFNQASY
jgi:hypothetical protein